VSRGRIIVGVPGPWADHGAVVKAIANASPTPAFLAAGTILLDTRTNVSLELDVCAHDSRMREAFAVAGGGALSDLELRRIGQHRTVVYIIGGDCSLAGARQMIAAATYLLDAGGFAVKVESAGLAHPADRWRHHARAGTTLSAYRAFVTLVGGDATDHHYSCGMQNFGLPDASVVGSVPVGDAANILTTFNHWNLIERPSLKDGAWFSCGAGEATFTARLQDFGYDAESTLNNPFGRWHLSPTDEPPPAAFAPQSQSQSQAKEPLFMALRTDSPELVEATRRARATTDYFLAHFASPHEYGRYMVKLRLTDGEDSAFFWTLLDEVDGDTLRVELFEVPPEFTSYETGQAIACRRDDLQDWAIIMSGTLVGGFSLRLQRSHVPEARRRGYDLFTGTLSYAPLDEIPGA
jgi:uncharacterized protein YegJ (DUF2314 family)